MTDILPDVNPHAPTENDASVVIWEFNTTTDKGREILSRLRAEYEALNVYNSFEDEDVGEVLDVCVFKDFVSLAPLIDSAPCILDYNGDSVPNDLKLADYADDKEGNCGANYVWLVPIEGINFAFSIMMY